jgi:hypothetical protein
VFGLTLALSLADNIFLNQSIMEINGLFPNIPISQIKAMVAGVGSSTVNALPAATQVAILHILIKSMSRIYIISLTGGCVTLVLSLCMKREKLFIKGSSAM